MKSLTICVVISLVVRELFQINDFPLHYREFLSLKVPGYFPPFQRHLADVGSVVVTVPHIGESAGNHVVRCNDNRLVRLLLNRDTEQNLT